MGPHFDSGKLSIVASYPQCMPSLSISMKVGLLVKLTTRSPFEAMGLVHLQKNFLLIGEFSSCKFILRQKVQYKAMSSSSSCLKVVTLRMLLTKLIRSFCSSAAIGGSILERFMGLSKVMFLQSSNSYLKKSPSMMMSLAKMIQSLRPLTVAQPDFEPIPIFCHLKLMVTQAKPPSMTMESLPTISARCLVSRQQKVGLALVMTQVTESLTLQDTLLRELIFSPSLVKVLFNSSFLPREMLFWNSKWVMLQFQLGYYVTIYMGSKAEAATLKSMTERQRARMRGFDMGRVDSRIYMIINHLGQKSFLSTQLQGDFVFFN